MSFCVGGELLFVVGVEKGLVEVFFICDVNVKDVLIVFYLCYGCDILFFFGKDYRLCVFWVMFQICDVGDLQYVFFFCFVDFEVFDGEFYWYFSWFVWFFSVELQKVVDVVVVGGMVVVVRNC